MAGEAQRVGGGGGGERGGRGGGGWAEEGKALPACS